MTLEWTRAVSGSALLAVLISFALTLAPGRVEAAGVNTFVAVAPDVPVTLPPNATNQNTTGTHAILAAVDSTVVVSGLTSAISKITVSMFIPDQFPHHLGVSLIGPDGTTVILKPRSVQGNTNGLGGIGTSSTAAPNGQVVFDDSSAQVVPTGSDVIPSGIYAPNQPLSAFKGRPVATATNGIWKLHIDLDTDDTGTIQAWSLTIWNGHTWNGSSSSTFSTNANWLPEAPKANSVDVEMVFPGLGVISKTPVNNIAGTLGVLLLTVSDSYTFTGTGTVQLEAGSTFFNAGVTSWAIPTTLGGTSNLNISTGSLTMSGGIGGTGGFTKIGAGTLSLPTANTFTGFAAINAGIVTFADPGGLGGTAAGSETSVGSGATLEYTGTGTVAEPLTIAGSGVAGIGALHTTAGGTWSGDLTFGVGTIDASGGTLNLTGALAGTVLTKIGASLLDIQSTFPLNAALVMTGPLNLDMTASLGDLTMSGGTLGGAANPVTLNGTISSLASSTVSTIAVPIDIGAGTRTFVVADDGTAANDLVITSTITGSGTISKTGSGTLILDGAATTENVSVGGGTLGGGGTIAAVTVGSGATLKPGGGTGGATLNVTSATFADNSAFSVVVNSTFLNASGAVDLGGVAGVGGAILLPYGTAGGTIITAAGGVTHVFKGLPDPTAGITYAPTSVSLGAGSGTTVFLDHSSYEVDVTGGSVTVTVDTQGGAGTVGLSTSNGSASLGVDFNAPTPGNTAFASGVAVPFTVNIPVTFVKGDHIFYVYAVPDISTGTRLAVAGPASAPVTIHNGGDDSKKKKCGFGSGLTVFFLFGFGVLLNLRTRRRR